MKLSYVIDELVQEKGLDRSILGTIITEGMLSAYKKKYPDLNLEASFNKKTDQIEIFVEKTVVSSVTNDDLEITLRRAKNFETSSEINNKIKIPFEGKIGRIEILKAKQVIAQKIRSIESEAVYKEFVSKQGSIVNGTINKCEYNGITIKIHDTFAFLPRSLSISTDKCIVGHSIRAILKDVLQEPKHENQLILERNSADFIKKLFELEVPEIFEKLVEIKKIIRAPGYKTKMIVVSNDKNIDPVGACVGVGGARIKPILKELGSEKIDIISLHGSLGDLIKDSLKPAIINKIEFIDNNKTAEVWLDEDERSVAIGKMGQNISLASSLTNVNIQLMTQNDQENINNKENKESAESD